MPSKEGGQLPYAVVKQEAPPPPPILPRVEQQEKHEDDPLAGISGFGLRIELGLLEGANTGGLLTDQEITNKETVTNDLAHFLKEDNHLKVDERPLAKFSTKEREETNATYEEWRVWMDTWITTAGKAPANPLYADRIQGLSALGINARDYISVTDENARKAMIKKLHEDYFENETNVVGLTDAFITTARDAETNTVSMDKLKKQLKAMEPFLASCGEGSKDAIKQHILLQGVAQADQVTKDALIQTAPEKVGKQPDEKEKRTIKGIREEYDQLHAAPDQQARPATGEGSAKRARFAEALDSKELREGGVYDVDGETLKDLLPRLQEGGDPNLMEAQIFNPVGYDNVTIRENKIQCSMSLLAGHSDLQAVYVEQNKKLVLLSSSRHVDVKEAQKEIEGFDKVVRDGINGAIRSKDLEMDEMYLEGDSLVVKLKKTQERWTDIMRREAEEINNAIAKRNAENEAKAEKEIQISSVAKEKESLTHDETQDAAYRDDEKRIYIVADG